LETNDLWIADVGQGEWEEINVAWADEGTGKGANFGWSAFEGTHRFNEDQSEDGVTMPIFEYEHGVDCSISGGVPYRGAALPSLVGWYIYGDYCSGQVRAFPVLDDRTAGDEFTLTTQLDSLTEVAQGPDGEVYVLSLADGGKVLALQPTG
jgi:glucose/arabinose dehydrogenase